MAQGNILVVDDSLDNLTLLADTLSAKGYAVRQAANGRQALEAVSDDLPDLILLDINMPGMSGYEVCKALKDREETEDIPVLFISALDETMDKVRAFEAGGVDYVTKPFHYEEMLMRIETHLSLHRLQQQLSSTNDELERRVRERTAELTELNRAYERFVPRAFLSHLNKDLITDVALGDHIQKDMTILFSDIRDFSAMSERQTPEETFAFLNAYLGHVSPVIHRHRGFIDKYLGDGLLAIFPGGADDAVQAATGISHAIADFNRQRQQRGLPPISVGSGVHTGRVILGVIGEKERMHGTVIADAVNMASRLEELTKVYGVSVIISAETLLHLEDRNHYHYRPLDLVNLKGKTKPVAVFEVFDGDPEQMRELKAKTRPDFARAMQLYHRQEYHKARNEFREVLSDNPNDSAVRLYLRRASQRLRRGVRSR